ncbi:unnamed protein product, partial [Allacma fusca]
MVFEHNQKYKIQFVGNYQVLEAHSTDYDRN